MSAPLLALEKVRKLYRRGFLDRTPAFQLEDKLFRNGLDSEQSAE